MALGNIGKYFIFIFLIAQGISAGKDGIKSGDNRVNSSKVINIDNSEQNNSRIEDDHEEASNQGNENEPRLDQLFQEPEDEIKETGSQIEHNDGKVSNQDNESEPRLDKLFEETDDEIKKEESQIEHDDDEASIQDDGSIPGLDKLFEETDDEIKKRGSNIFKPNNLQEDDPENIELIKEPLSLNILKDKTASQHSDNDNDISYLTPDRIIAIMMYGFLIVTGLYVTYFGFRIFRLLMVILGFYVSYYTILFCLTEYELYDSKNVGHQLGLFFGCIILGFIIAIVCYLMEKVNFVIFGISIGTVITLFYAQFFINFSEFENRKYLLLVLLVTSLTFITYGFFMLDQSIIWGSALVGSVITVINFGVIVGHIDSFENREVLPDNSLNEFITYITSAIVLFVIGICSQYYLRKRIISRFSDKTIEDLEDGSFVN